MRPSATEHAPPCVIRRIREVDLEHHKRSFYKPFKRALLRGSKHDAASIECVVHGHDVRQANPNQGDTSDELCCEQPKALLARQLLKTGVFIQLDHIFHLLARHV